MQGVRIGQQDILDFMAKEFKIFSWRTVQRWKKKGMPIASGYNTQPVIIEAAVKSWFLKCFK